MKALATLALVAAGMLPLQTVLADGQSLDKKDVACPTGACMASPATAQPTVAVAKEPVINTEALSALLRLKVPVIVLDARGGKYDDGRRIPGAKSLTPMAKDEEVAAALPDKTALVVTYCTDLKCPASHMLGEKLRALGYQNVLEDHEGIEGWVAAGHPVEKVKVP